MTNPEQDRPTPGGHEAPPVEQSGSFPDPVLDFPAERGPAVPPQFQAPQFGAPPPYGPPQQFGPPQFAAPPQFAPPPQFGAPAQFGPPMGYPAPPPQSALYPVQPPTNGMAIGSLVTSLVAVPFAFFCYGIIGIPAAIVAIVLGVVALNQLKTRPQRGKEMAIAGIVVGGIALVLTVISIVVLGVLVATHSGHHGL